jgi:hypothetical protein
MIEIDVSPDELLMGSSVLRVGIRLHVERGVGDSMWPALNFLAFRAAPSTL